MARISKILGPDGQPINLDALFGPPKAAPSLTGVRSPVSGHPADGLTPARLAAIHRAAANGDPLAYLELAEDIEERDMHYLGVLGTRRRQVAQLPITVEAASEDTQHEAHADLVREWLGDGVLDAALFDLLDAIGKGYSIMEIEWEPTPRRVVPKALTWRPQRWFALDDLSLDEPLLMEGATHEPLAPHRFLIHRHPSKSGLAIRSGLARVASWGWMYKAFTLRDWAIFVQNYGQPMRVGRYGPGASADDIDVLWRAVGSIAGDCAAVIPRGMEIEFIQLQNTADGSQLYEKRADWMDRQISKLVLGQTATTDAIAGGHAVGQEHRLVQEDLERADAKLLSATLTRQLVPYLISLNFGPQERYPKIMIGRPDELPIEVLINALDKLGPQGLEVEESQLLDRLGFTEPAREANGKPVRMVGGRAKAAAPQAPQEPPAAHQQQAGGLTRHLLSLHASAPEPEYVERLSARLAREAEGALAGLTAEIRHAFDEAADMRDLADRLERMQLDPAAFAEAMQRGMALAYLTGQAAVMDDLRAER